MRIARNSDWECELQEFLLRYRRHRANKRLARRVIKHSSRRWIWHSITFLAALILLKVSLVEAFFVPSGSMAPTIQPQDYILVPKFLYGLQLPLRDKPLATWGAPKRGDVVVFRQSSETRRGATSSNLMVKRVIALEGDLVEMLEGQVYINGLALVEPYAKGVLQAPEGYHFGPYRVPTGRLFVLGDNRQNSEDSRYWLDPFIPVDQVLGRAIMVYWSNTRGGRSGTVL